MEMDSAQVERLQGRVWRYKRLLDLDAPPLILAGELRLVEQAKRGVTAAELCEAMTTFPAYAARNPWNPLDTDEAS